MVVLEVGASTCHSRSVSQLSPPAIRVRDLIERIGPLITAGDPAWRPLLEEAELAAQEITDPFSADDAATRLGTIRSHERLLAGDYSGAMLHLNGSLAAIGRQYSRVSDSDGRARLADHEWVANLNICQLAVAMADWPAAIAAAERCADLADATLDPKGRARTTVVTIAALDLGRGRLKEAVSGYRQAAELFRAEDPHELGTVLLGLAQAEMMMGSFADARRNLDRAAPLLDGDANQLASLREARAFIAARTGQETAPDLLRHYSAEVTAELDPAHQSGARTAAAAAMYIDGDLAEAKSRFDTLIAEARESGDPMRLADVLVHASAATQDLALATGDPTHAERLHHAAMALLAEANDVFSGGEHPLRAASIEVAHADYVSQWHPHVDGTNIQLLRAAFDRADAAAALLRAASLEVESAPARRDFAALHAAHGFEVACELAFRLGDKESLARLITERAAGYDWRAGQP